jgi:hypothetical protein
MAGTSVYGPELVFAKGTDGLYEIEPSMRWNPAVVAGVGMAPDPFPLYRDMHSYLASAGVPLQPMTSLPLQMLVARVLQVAARAGQGQASACLPSGQ